MKKQHPLQEGAASDSGIVRPQNEDSYGSFRRPLAAFDTKHAASLLVQKGRLYIVADGMGGHEGGEIASAMAVEQIERGYYANESNDPATALAAAITSANSQIYAAAQAQSGQAKRPMGTTVVCAVVTDARLTVAHVGDSRAYRLRGSTLEQLTEDHDWLTAQMRTQRMSRAEAQAQARQRGANGVLLRALGAQSSVQPDITTQAWQAGDTLLLCSDGLHGLIDDQQIARVLAAQPPQAAARALIDAANQAGGHDNITALVIGKPAVIAPAQPWTRRVMTLGALVVAMLLVMLGATLPVANGQPLFSSNRVLEIAGLPTLQPTSGILPTVTATATSVPPTATATTVPTATALPTYVPTRIPTSVSKPTAKPEPNLDRPTAASKTVNQATPKPADPPATAQPAAPQPSIAPSAAPAQAAPPADSPVPPTATVVPTAPPAEPAPGENRPAPTAAPAPPTAQPPTVATAGPINKPSLPTIIPPTAAILPTAAPTELPTAAPPTAAPPTAAPIPATAAPIPPTAAPATAAPIPPTAAPATAAPTAEPQATAQPTTEPAAPAAPATAAPATAAPATAAPAEPTAAR